MSLNEKLKKITSENSSNWQEEAREKIANTGARKNARKVALRVLHLLRERGITQTELAEKMGVSRQQVTKIVKGKENFTFETIDKLERALDTTLMKIEEPVGEPEQDSIPEEHAQT
jgi:DNA-binding Xre family transcriptional regulator